MNFIRLNLDLTYLGLLHAFAVQKELVLLVTHCASQDHLVGLDGQTPVAVVEDDLHICGHDRRSRPFMEKILAVLLAQVGELWSEQHELDRVEEIAALEKVE